MTDQNDLFRACTEPQTVYVRSVLCPLCGVSPIGSSCFIDGLPHTGKATS